MTKPLFIILANETPDDHLLWEQVCKSKADILDYKIVNLTENDWLKNIQTYKSVKCLLAKPPGLSANFKQQYDEKLSILKNYGHYNIFPSLEECLIYENKRYLSYWLEANNIPHPDTFVFYHKDEALKTLPKDQLPLVGKVNIGASGSGVSILKTREDVKVYINNAFSGQGIKRRSGPNLEKGGLIRRGLHYVWHPADIAGKLKKYKQVSRDIQKDFVILQEFIPHKFEWRVVRIGDSFFAHKKLISGEKASGSLLKGYENPPFELLNFVKKITDKHQFYSQAVDIFESERGYLVNEMQCIFGQSDPYQMLVDGKPGRYRFVDNQWLFEEGDFASNQCYDLRLDFVLNQLK
jgi:hypothetical protein